MLESDLLQKQKTLYSQSEIAKAIREWTDNRDWGDNFGIEPKYVHLVEQEDVG